MGHQLQPESEHTSIQIASLQAQATLCSLRDDAMYRAGYELDCGDSQPGTTQLSTAQSHQRGLLHTRNSVSADHSRPDDLSTAMPTAHVS